MAKFWELVFLCWAWSPLSLSSNVSFISSPQECEKAHFVPGYNLGGEGFNIVTMARKGAYVIDTEKWKLEDGSCRMYRNIHMNNNMQKVPIAVVDWRSIPQCSLSISSTLYDSVESLVNDSTSSVTNNWKIGLNIPMASAGLSLGGSHSKASEFGMQKSKQDRYTFFHHSVHCNFYSYRLAAKPPLSKEFEAAVNSLPPYSCNTQHLYNSFIDTYGTHYITQVFLGGEMKAITAVKTCLSTLNELSATEIKDCLSAEASASYGRTAEINAMYEHCKDKRKSLKSGQDFSHMFNERRTEVIGGDIGGSEIIFQGESNYGKWINSLKTIPDVVRYNLKPLHTILPNGHRAQTGLKQEVEQYIKKNAVLKKCSESCQIGHRSNPRDPCACVCNYSENLRSNCCPAKKGLATLKVYNLYAKNLYGDEWTETDGSVEVKYDSRVGRTAIILDDDNPRWPEVFNFGTINLKTNNIITVTAYDEDTYWNSDLLGSCLTNLRRGVWTGTCTLDHGTIFFTYNVICAPNLTGDRCQDYMPSPMSPSLAKTFYTRNGILFGDSGEQCTKSAS